MSIPGISFEHLFRLSDRVGLFEHAELTTPRPAHGYCVDDVARGLLVVVREPDPTPARTDLARLYLKFVVDAQVSDGRFHNRRGLDRRWQDEPSLEDCWGRALWGLGVTVAKSPELAAKALAHFNLSVSRRSPYLRAMAFGALGAAEVLRVQPGHSGATSLLADTAALIRAPRSDRRWRWPEKRLRYANAILPETLLAAGSLLGDSRALSDGLDMLSWLLQIETSGDHISVTPVDGWSLGDPRPGYDQQPIEVAALAEACATAFDVTNDYYWMDGLNRCTAWFLGDNDAGAVMFDPVSGGGFDGLEPGSRNENQGAESTLAMMSTFQQANRMLAQAGV